VLSLATVKQRVGAVIRRSPETSRCWCGGTALSPTARLSALMAGLQEAGASGVGLVTEDPR
jgi:biopolymer transport protein TolR